MVGRPTLEKGRHILIHGGQEIGASQGSAGFQDEASTADIVALLDVQPILGTMYNRQALVEATMFRCKRIIGPVLRSRNPANQKED